LIVNSDMFCVLQLSSDYITGGNSAQTAVTTQVLPGYEQKMTIRKRRGYIIRLQHKGLLDILVQ